MVLYALDDGLLDELNEFENRWQNFLASIINEHRFFNKTAKQYLDDLFEVLLVHGEIASTLLSSVDIETSLYRARIAGDPSVLKEIKNDPASQLGPPPSHLASSQRMTPEGISAFYGAFDRETCISEIRPLVGDSVVSAEFRALKPLHLLDLNKLVTLDPCVDIFSQKIYSVQSCHSVFQ